MCVWLFLAPRIFMSHPCDFEPMMGCVNNRLNRYIQQSTHSQSFGAYEKYCTVVRVGSSENAIGETTMTTSVVFTGHQGICYVRPNSSWCIYVLHRNQHTIAHFTSISCSALCPYFSRFAFRNLSFRCFSRCEPRIHE